MRKKITPIGDFKFSDDYKLAWSEMEMINNFESIEKWLYLGADAVNPTFARIGITLGDLGSRSYSSANPNYFLFCAFKCKYDLSVAQLKSIEDDILAKFEYHYVYPNGSTKRARFYESGCFSDCFYDVDFLDFYQNLHFEIYKTHREKFNICGADKGFGIVDGEFVQCEFSPKLNQQDKNQYRKVIIQYD